MKNPYNDSNALRLEEICRLYGLDPYAHNIKEAEESPRARFYGYPAADRYPLDSPERVRLSWAYANEDVEAGELRDEILGNIKKAADFWKIELPSRINEDVDAYEFKVSGEGWENTFRVDSPGRLKEVVDHVRKNASDFAYPTKVQYADGIIGAPRELKSGLTDEDIDWLRHVKCEILTDGESVKKACDLRASYLEHYGHPELAESFRGMSAAVAGRDNVEVSLLCKVASAMDLADRAGGISHLYANGELPFPEFSIEGYTPEAIKNAKDDMTSIKEGSITSRNRIALHRPEIDDFFMKIAGEDTSKMDMDALVERLRGMDAVEREAFEDIVGGAL